MISAIKSLECQPFNKSLYLAPKLGFLPTLVEQYDKHNLPSRVNWFWKNHGKFLRRPTQPRLAGSATCTPATYVAAEPGKSITAGTCTLQVCDVAYYDRYVCYIEYGL